MVPMTFLRENGAAAGTRRCGAGRVWARAAWGSRSWRGSCRKPRKPDRGRSGARAATERLGRFLADAGAANGDAAALGRIAGHELESEIRGSGPRAERAVPQVPPGAVRYAGQARPVYLLDGYEVLGCRVHAGVVGIDVIDGSGILDANLPMSCLCSGRPHGPADPETWGRLGSAGGNRKLSFLTATEASVRPGAGGRPDRMLMRRVVPAVPGPPAAIRCSLQGGAVRWPTPAGRRGAQTLCTRRSGGGAGRHGRGRGAAAAGLVVAVSRLPRSRGIFDDRHPARRTARDTSRWQAEAALAEDRSALAVAVDHAGSAGSA